MLPNRKHDDMPLTQHETSEDDADRRADSIVYRWYEPMMSIAELRKIIANEIRAAVEAEKDRCAVLAYQIGQSHPEAGGREVAAAIRARGEAS